jgi:hypothetical protein
MAVQIEIGLICAEVLKAKHAAGARIHRPPPKIYFSAILAQAQLLSTVKFC